MQPSFETNRFDSIANSLAYEPAVLQPIVQSMTVQTTKPVELVNNATTRIVNLGEVSLVVNQLVSITDPSSIGSTIKW